MHGLRGILEHSSACTMFESRPRILMIVNGDDRYESRVRRAAETVAKEGYEVVVIGRLIKKNRPEKKIEVTEGVTYQRVKLKWTKIPILKRLPLHLHLRIDRETRNFVKQYRPSYIHAHDLTSLRIAIRIAHWSNAKVIYDSHEFFTDELPETSWLGKQYTRVVENQLIRKADAVITVSDGIADLLESTYGISRPIVIHNSVIPAKLDHGLQGKGYNIKSDLGLDVSEILAVYVGGRHVSRGVATLIEALSKTEFLHLAMVGLHDPDHDGPLMDLAQRLNCADRLHLIAPVPHGDVTRFIGTADFGIVPQYGTVVNIVHSLPNKFFECMFSGIPFLYSDLPEMRQIAKKAGMGLAIDCSNSDSIANAMRSFAGEYQKWKPSPEKYDAAAEQFGWGVGAQKLVALYASL